MKIKISLEVANFFAPCVTVLTANDLSSQRAWSVHRSAQISSVHSMSNSSLTCFRESNKNLRSATVLFNVKAKYKIEQKLSYNPGSDARNVCH